MTALTPNTAPLNLSYTFSLTDLRGKKPEMCIRPDSVYGIISKHPKLTKLKHIVHTAQYEAQLNDGQYNSTLFAPHDDSLKHIPEDFWKNLDVGAAKQILYSMTLPRKVNGTMIMSSPVSSLTSCLRKNRIYTTNICGKTRLNDCATVIQYDVNASNGIIHITDNILVPNDNTYIN